MVAARVGSIAIRGVVCSSLTLAGVLYPSARRVPLMFLCNARLPSGSLADVEIADGVIAAVRPPTSADPSDHWIDVEERLVMPAFVEGHVHLDKTHWGRRACRMSRDAACASGSQPSASRGRCRATDRGPRFGARSNARRERQHTRT